MSCSECNCCLVPAILAVLFSTILFLKWLLGIDDLNSLMRIISSLSNKRQHWVSNLFQVEEESKRNGGELVAEVLKAHDVSHVFTLCGGHISPM